MLARTLTLVVLAGWLSDAGAAAGNPYVEFRAAAVKRCEAIDRAEYQSGLLFNPDGYRSFYVRSACLQRAAVKFRDASLCARVRQRWSLISSSWGYSAKRCRELVDEGAAADGKALEEAKGRYAKGAVRLRDFRIERNGNGRDFDIIPAFDGGYAHGYTLRFEIIDAERMPGSVLLESSGFHLKGGDNVRIFVRQADVRQRFPHFQLGRPYRVRGTLTLSVGHGGQSGMWSDAFIARVFPAAARTEVLVKEAVF
jgi:hypothetical protein